VQHGFLRSAIVGHSIPHTDKQAIIVEIREYCPCPTLALLRPNEPHLEESVEANRPDLLLDAVQRLLSRRATA
jgi:hypothetical protein